MTEGIKKAVDYATRPTTQLRKLQVHFTSDYATRPTTQLRKLQVHFTSTFDRVKAEFIRLAAWLATVGG